MAWSAAQDASGNLYVGCDTVVSFDGDRCRALPMDPTFGVRGLDIGTDGRIWAAGVNQIGWFAERANGKFAYTSLVPLLPKSAAALGDVWRVYAEGRDRALFVTHDKVLRWDSGKFTVWEYPGLRLLWSTRTRRAIYVHYPPLGLLRIGEAGPERAIPAAMLGPDDIQWLDDSGNNWLMVTTGGLKVFSRDRCTPVASAASGFIQANSPTAVGRLRDGTLPWERSRAESWSSMRPAASGASSTRAPVCRKPRCTVSSSTETGPCGRWAPPTLSGFR